MVCCLEADMEILARSSDLKVTPLSLDVWSTVSFSFSPTDRASSCCRSSLLSVG